MTTTRRDMLEFRLHALADCYERMADRLRAAAISKSSDINEKELRDMEGSADICERLYLRDLVKKATT